MLYSGYTRLTGLSNTSSHAADLREIQYLQLMTANGNTTGVNINILLVYWHTFLNESIKVVIKSYYDTEVKTHDTQISDIMKIPLK